jgi:ferrous iron transport protein B
MHLTGAHFAPVNFPGSSVERAEGVVKFDDREGVVVDLPGIASLTAISNDEVVAVEYLRDLTTCAENILCAVLDATKLSVELRLLKELASLDLPMVVALTKNDLARRRGAAVDIVQLAADLGVPVVEVDGLRGRGFTGLSAALAGAQERPRKLAEDFDPVRVSEAAGGAEAPLERTGFSERLDGILLHRIWGLPILVLVLFAVFQSVFTIAVPVMDLVDKGQGSLCVWVEGALEPGALRSFVVDGLINGVGSVLIFLPQIIILVILITVLEASGYMARAAFLLDKLMGKVGLSGRSFVPLVSSFACAVPGIMATRTIRNERDRIATIVVAPLMSCSARLPVYVLLIGAFFPASQAGVVLFSMYLLGIVVAAAVAWLLRKTLLKGGQSIFMMELPHYQPPSLRVVFIRVWSDCRDFVRMAGTLIFGTAVLI